MKTRGIDLGLMVLRLVLGVIFIAHGGQKVMGWFGGKGLAATVHGMGMQGIPALLAYLACFTEFLGGIAVLLGLFSRVAAAGLAVVMLVAIFKVHLSHGLMGPTGFEFPLSLLAIALCIVLSGPGQLAVGDWEPRIFGKRP